MTLKKGENGFGRCKNFTPSTSLKDNTVQALMQKGDPKFMSLSPEDE
jgi:hypothetical protein